MAGGTPPYFYSITAGQVPPGLTFDETDGTFSGTPTLRGSFGIVLNVADSGGTVTVGPGGSLTAKQATRATVTTNYTIEVSGPGDFQITTGQDLPVGTLGFSYSTTLTASGGQAPYQWRLVDGTLPRAWRSLAAGPFRAPRASGSRRRWSSRSRTHRGQRHRGLPAADRRPQRAGHQRLSTAAAGHRWGGLMLRAPSPPWVAIHRTPGPSTDTSPAHCRRACRWMRKAASQRHPDQTRAASRSPRSYG